MSENFSLSTQFEIGEISIDGNDVIGLFQVISIYESIFSPVITGDITLLDSDGSDFIAKYKIEGNEELRFSFTDAGGTQLQFAGYLNGFKDKLKDKQNSMFTFEFTAEGMRKNEESWVTKRFKEETPDAIVEDMTKRITAGPHGTNYKIDGRGEPMSFLGSRRRPCDIIEHVMTHGISTGNTASATDQQKAQEEETKGTTGFLFWQTTDGYCFSSIDGVLSGSFGNSIGDFDHKLQNKGLTLSERRKSIIQYDFEVMGDMQSKMRSGAFKNVVVSFDMDKGLYKEYTYNDETNMTDKQKAAVTKPTRYMFKPFVNERFETTCSKAKDNSGDQSRRYLAQNTVRQNTFSDQKGNFVLSPHFETNAGDYFVAKLPKVQSESDGGYNEKHSGRYIIEQVGHHLFSDGRAYTKVKTIRSTIQQDDATSTKS